MLPTISPSDLPTSSVPSATPTITGAVASISISGEVTEDLSEDNINAITTDLAEIYGVDVTDVETTVDYVISGTLDVTIPESIPTEDAISSLEQSIGDVLCVHPRDVVVTINEDGEVNYSVTGGSYDEVEQIQTIASGSDFASDITTELGDNDSVITVESSTLIDEVEVVVSATVDTTDATGTVEPESAVSDLAQDYDLTESIVQGNKTSFH